MKAGSRFSGQTVQFVIICHSKVFHKVFFRHSTLGMSQHTSKLVTKETYFVVVKILLLPEVIPLMSVPAITISLENSRPQLCRQINKCFEFARLETLYLRHAWQQQQYHACIRNRTALKRSSIVMSTNKRSENN